MKNPTTTPVSAEAAEARFGFRVAARLNEAADELDADIGERLRFAREQALERARLARAAQSRPALSLSAGAVAVLAGGTGWWAGLASLLPLIALAGGLFLIQQLHDEAQVEVAAQIDAELLADDLPPSAYSDDGFVEYLKAPRD